MKLSISFLIFCTVLVSRSSFAFRNHIPVLNQNENLADFACKVTKDVVSSQSHTQDVLIGNVGEKSQSLMVNDITKCIGDENTVIAADLKTPMTEKKLRKASVVVLVADRLDVKSLYQLIVTNQFSKVWHHMAKVLLISTNRINYNQQILILKVFSQMGFIDVAIASENSDVIEVSILESVRGDMLIYKNLDDTQIIFADKLKNLQGYAYRIVLHDQVPRVSIKNRTIRTAMIHFLSTVVNLQNASVNVRVLSDYKELSIFWDNRQMDLTLNSAVTFPDASYAKLLTYEETGYCALVPRPPKVSLSEMIYVKPFDKLTWMFLFLTIACCGAVWKLFRGRGAVVSHWLLVYGIFVMFIGQGVNLTRKNRMVLTILLQLIIFMVFVLSNAYEGVITSFMIQPIQENRLERFDQILAGDYEIMVDEGFGNVVKDLEEFKAIKSRINTSAVQMSYNRYTVELKRQKYVFVRDCDIAEYNVNTRIPNLISVSDYYYLLPERIVNYYVRLEASYLNPFIERLQYYMDLSFQAGLPHIWKIYEAENVEDHTHQRTVKEPNILVLRDLVQLFYVLFIGYGVATCVFLIEIFFHGFLRNLQFAYLGRRLRNRVNQMAYKKKLPKHPKYQRGALFYIIRQHKKVKRLRKLKVRKIFVQPRNIEN